MIQYMVKSLVKKNAMELIISQLDFHFVKRKAVQKVILTLMVFVLIVVQVHLIVKIALMKSVSKKQMEILFVMNVKVMNICYQNLENARNVI